MENLKTLIGIISNEMKIPVEKIKSQKRSANNAVARYFFSHIGRHYLKEDHGTISKMLNRSRSIVSASGVKIDKILNRDPEMKKLYLRILSTYYSNDSIEMNKAFFFSPKVSSLVRNGSFYKCFIVSADNLKVVGIAQLKKHKEGVLTAAFTFKAEHLEYCRIGTIKPSVKFTAFTDDGKKATAATVVSFIHYK